MRLFMRGFSILFEYPFSGFIPPVFLQINADEDAAIAFALKIDCNLHLWKFRIGKFRKTGALLTRINSYDKIQEYIRQDIRIGYTIFPCFSQLFGYCEREVKG